MMYNGVSVILKDVISLKVCIIDYAFAIRYVVSL